MIGIKIFLSLISASIPPRSPAMQTPGDGTEPQSQDAICKTGLTGY